MGRWDIALPIHNLGARSGWVVNATPGRFAPGKRLSTHFTRDAWASGSVSMSPENLASTGFRTPDHQACIKSLYRPQHTDRNIATATYRPQHTDHNIPTTTYRPQHIDRNIPTALERISCSYVRYKLMYIRDNLLYISWTDRRHAYFAYTVCTVTFHLISPHTICSCVFQYVYLPDTNTLDTRQTRPVVKAKVPRRL